VPQDASGVVLMSGRWCNVVRGLARLARCCTRMVSAWREQVSVKLSGAPRFLGWPTARPLCERRGHWQRLVVWDSVAPAHSRRDRPEESEVVVGGRLRAGRQRGEARERV
jgi:hypothetical protein